MVQQWMKVCINTYVWYIKAGETVLSGNLRENSFQGGYVFHESWKIFNSMRLCPEKIEWCEKSSMVRLWNNLLDFVICVSQMPTWVD